MLALTDAAKVKFIYGECRKRRTKGLERALRSNSYTYAQIAQLVEQRTENPRVAGSIPALGITTEYVVWDISSVGRALDF